MNQNKLSKIYAVVALVLVVGFLAGFFWLLYLKNQNSEFMFQWSENQMPDAQLADWKTYRNEQYGFEVKYPSDLTKTVIQRTTYFHDCPTEYSLTHTETECSRIIGVLMETEIGSTPNSVTQIKELFSEKVHKLYFQLNGYDFFVEKSMPYEVLQWKAMTPLINSGWPTFIFKGKAYYTASQEENVTEEELKKIVTILSTFKFIK